jgi:hydroxyacyl-ACP dehydratase HTD2-like protein with hotdog domain
MASVETLPVDGEGSSYARAVVVARFVPNEIELFMYCAAAWNTHRIHYDRDYARAEGYRDLVVPGPMQSARLAQMLADFAAGYDGRLRTMSVRHRTALYCNEPVELRADLLAVDGSVLELSVVARNPEGIAATDGTATLKLSPTPRAQALLDALRSGTA